MLRPARRNDDRRATPWGAIPSLRGLLWLVAGSSVALATGVLGATAARPVWVERTTWVMGTTLSATVAGATAGAGIRAIEAAFDSVRAFDAVLSTWRDGTELARVNVAPLGVRLPISPRLTRLLAVAGRWTQETGGAFDPAVGPLVAAWDLRGPGRRPGPDDLAAARAASGIGRFALDTAAREIRRLAARAALDAGGFGKGAALDAAAHALRSPEGHGALLDFGGQVLALGVGPDGRPWAVRVADPRDRRRAVLTLRLAERSAATSAQSERFVTVASEHLGHVLDPRTGRPVSAWGSVTVVHPEALTADILSTALFVMGPDTGLAWAAARGVAALFLVREPQQLDVRCTHAIHLYLMEDMTCR